MMEQDIIYRQDQEEVDAGTTPERQEVIRRTITTFRRSDRLSVGDPVPELNLLRLTDGGTVNLGEPVQKPIVLFFGSYT